MLKFRKKPTGEKGPFESQEEAGIWAHGEGRRLIYAIYDLRKNAYLLEPVARIIENGEILNLKERARELNGKRYEVRFVMKGYIPKHRRDAFWAVPDYYVMERYRLEQFLKEN